MATALYTERLVLRPFGQQEFDHFVTEMLTDPRVVEFYYAFRDEVDMDRIRQQAQDDFWDLFAESRANHKLEIWAACESAGDIPNVGSIRVLEKLGFQLEGQIEAYGSDQMCLYFWRPADTVVH